MRAAKIFLWLLILGALGAAVYFLFLAPKPKPKKTASYLDGSLQAGLIPAESKVLWGSVGSQGISSDPKAKWIGNSGANPSEFGNVQLQYIYDNTTNAPIAGVLVWAVDDGVVIYQDDVKLVSGSGGYGAQTSLKKTDITLAAGQTLICFEVENGYSVGGMIASCQSKATPPAILFSSDTTWKVRPKPKPAVV